MIEGILQWGTIATLAAATLFFLALIALKVKKKSNIRRDFTLWVWAFMAAWLGAEILGLLSPPLLEVAIDAAHFAVLLLFALFLIVRWSWALRGAAREVRT